MKMLAVPLVIAAVSSISWMLVAAAATMPDGTAAVSIGDGVTSKGDFNGKVLPLAEALKALPPSGGRIEILPGTYEVESCAAVSVPNVAISGSGNSTRIAVRSSEGPVDFVLADKNASGFTLRDCAFVWSPGDGERALVALEGSNARVQNCTFGLANQAGRTAWASFVSFGGKESASRGLWATDNMLSPGDWSRGLRVERSVGIHVTGNRFEGKMGEPSQGVYVRNSNQQQYVGNSFNGFGKRNGPHASHGILIDNTGGDVGHLEITGNHFHTFFGSGTSAVKCVQTIYASITGNVFGRCQGWGNSAVHLSGTSATNFSGNQIENSDGGDDGIVVLVTGNSNGVSISSNNFSDNYVTEVGIVSPDNRRGSGVAVLSNLFDGRAHPHERAIEVKGSEFDSLFIANNTFNNYVDANPVLAEETEGIMVKGNMVLSPTPREVWEQLVANRRRKFGPPEK